METARKIHSEPDCCWGEPPEIRNYFFWQSHSWSWTRTGERRRIRYLVLDKNISTFMNENKHDINSIVQVLWFETRGAQNVHFEIEK